MVCNYLTTKCFRSTLCENIVYTATLSRMIFTHKTVRCTAKLYAIMQGIVPICPTILGKVNNLLLGFA